MSARAWVIVCFCLLLCSNDAWSQRRSVRVDAGNWENQVAFASCPDASSTGATVIRQGITFAGPQNAHNTPLRSFAGCQVPTAPYNGRTYENIAFPDYGIIGLVGRNLDNGSSVIRYNFPFANGEMSSDGSYQWTFFDFPRQLRLVGLYGLLVGTTPQPLTADTFISQAGNTLWRGDTDGHQGEYFCFSYQRYLGTWNGTRRDANSACLRHILVAPRLPQVVSRSRFAVPVEGQHQRPELTSDARYVVFESNSNKFWPQDFNNQNDVFLFDRSLGQLHLLSTTIDEDSGNAESGEVAVAADASHAVFASSATNLRGVAGIGRRAVLLHDMQTDALQVLNGSGPFSALSNCRAPDVGKGANTVVFACTQQVAVGMSFSSQEVLAVSQRSPAPGKNFIATVGGVGVVENFLPRLSDDGLWVALATATSWSGSDSNALSDIYLLSVASEGFQLISVNAGGHAGNGASDQPAVSENGCRIAFRSESTDLVAGDSNGVADVFLRDRCAGTTQRISLRPDGSQLTAASGNPSISADGKYVSFETNDSVIKSAAGVTGTAVAVRDIDGAQTRALAAPTLEGETFNQFALRSMLSADGFSISLLSAGSVLSDVLLVVDSAFRRPTVFIAGGFEAI